MNNSLRGFLLSWVSYQFLSITGSEFEVEEVPVWYYFPKVKNTFHLHCIDNWSTFWQLSCWSHANSHFVEVKFDSNSAFLNLGTSAPVANLPPNHSDQGSFENCYSHSWVCIHTSCIPSCRYFCTHVSKKPSFMFSNKKKHLFILLHINPTTFFTSVHSMFCFIA